MQFKSITKSSGRCKAVPIPGKISGDTLSVPVARQYPPVIYDTLSYYTMQFIYIHDCTILHCTMREYSTYYTILYHIILYYTLLYRTVSHYIILYNIAPYRTILYGSVLYYIIFDWLVIYYTRRSFQSIERVRTPIDSSIFNLLNHPAFLPSLLRRSRQSAECVTYVIRTSPTYGKPHPKHNPFI